LNSDEWNAAFTVEASRLEWSLLGLKELTGQSIGSILAMGFIFFQEYIFEWDRRIINPVQRQI